MGVLHTTTALNMRFEFCSCLCFQVLRRNNTIILSYLFEVFFIQKFLRHLNFESACYFPAVCFHRNFHTTPPPCPIPSPPIFPTKCHARSSSLVWSFKMQHSLLCFTHWLIKKEGFPFQCPKRRLPPLCPLFVVHCSILDASRNLGANGGSTGNHIGYASKMTLALASGCLSCCNTSMSLPACPASLPETAQAKNTGLVFSTLLLPTYRYTTIKVKGV